MHYLSDNVTPPSASQLLRVAHIWEPELVPQTTFIHTRLLNPICQRPVPVLTHISSPEYRNCPDLQIFEMARLHPIRLRLEYALEYRLHWSSYYFQVLRSLRPQVIHAHFSGAGEVSLWSARWLGIPLIVNFYGIETNYHIHDPFWLPRYQRLYRAADGFICSSEEMKTGMLVSGCPEDKIHVVRCSVNTDLFVGKPTPLLSGEPLRMLSIARLHPEKGLEYLLQACKLLDQADVSGWELSIVGEGKTEGSLKQLTSQLSLEGRVNFLGYKRPEEIVKLLQQAHVFILPSMKESQGVVLQEAQATTTPVIASRVGGIPEGVLDGETGYLVTAGDPASLRDAILRFYRSPELISKMGKAGRKFVMENFSRPAEYLHLETLYKYYSSRHKITKDKEAQVKA